VSAIALLENVIASHGGRDRWQKVASLEASLSSGGLAFTLHCQPFALRKLSISVQPHERRVVLRDFCQPGWVGIWTPNHVRIVDEYDVLAEERRDPRPQFRRLVKNVLWDKLDILYFAGYALWNYLSFPFLLEEPGVSVSEPADSGAGGPRRLIARFDAAVPTHSPQQVFHFDGDYRLTRHDYTADVIGAWATAANCCLASETVAGLRFYTRRKVFPRMGPRQWVLPLPTLVWIEIDDLRVIDLEGGSTPP